MKTTMKMKTTNVKTRANKLVAMLLTAAMIVGVIAAMPFSASASVLEQVFAYPERGYTVTYAITSSWNGGQNNNARVTITNTGTEVIENWMLAYDLMGTVSMHSGGTIFTSPCGVTYIKNTGTNMSGYGDSVNINPGMSVRFEYSLSNPTGVPDSFELRQKRVALVRGVDYEIEVNPRPNTDWGTQFQGDFLIHNLTDSPIEFWEMTFVSNNFTLQNSWERTLIDHGNNRHTIKPVAGNILRIAPNSTLTLGFQANKDTATGLADLDVIFESLTQVVFGEAAVVVPPETDCRFGGRIESPTELNQVNFLNGNTPDGSRMSLDFSVLELISGTAIRANEIFGLAVVTWGPNTENRQATIEVNGVASPRFHGASAYDSSRIWAIMSHGNPPNNGGRTEEQRLVYMNKYGSQNASDVTGLRPFVDSVNPARFDVRIRANNEHISMITEVLLLDENGRALGGAIFANGSWSPLVAFVWCGDCRFCDSAPTDSQTMRAEICVTENRINFYSNQAIENQYTFIFNVAGIGHDGSETTEVNIELVAGGSSYFRTLNPANGMAGIAGRFSQVRPAGTELANLYFSEAGLSVTNGLENVRVYGEQVSFSGWCERSCSANCRPATHCANGRHSWGGWTLAGGNETRVCTRSGCSASESRPIGSGGDRDGNFGEGVEYRLSLDAEYISTTGAISLSWTSAKRLRGMDFEVPVTTGVFEIQHSTDGVNFTTLTTVNDRFSHAIQTDGTDFVVRHFRVVQTVGDAAVHSNSDYVIWSPEGVCWTEYTRLWEFDGDDLPRINTDDNPFALSIRFEAAGVPALHLRAVESGYSNAMRNDDMTFGIIPEFVYRDGLRVENVRLEFAVQESELGDALGLYPDHPEFEGVRRLNVFRWFDEINMSLPVETTIDNSGNLVYTGDSFGAFALMDMEQWFAFLESQTADVGFAPFSSGGSSGFRGVIPSNWSVIELDAALCPDSDVDTDKDGLRDWDELAIGVWDAINGGSSTINLPTVQEVLDFLDTNNDWAARFDREFAGGLLELFEARVLPILSNPARADSDGDGIWDIFEHCKDYIGGLRGRLITAHIPFNIDDWLAFNSFEMEEGVHGGPLWRDTVESMYVGLANSYSRTIEPCGRRIYDEMRRTYVELSGNHITLGVYVHITFEGFCQNDDICDDVNVCVCDRSVQNALRTTGYTREESDVLSQLLAIIGVEIGAADITFEQLITAAMKFNFNSEVINRSLPFEGTIYDFFPGMEITTDFVVSFEDVGKPYLPITIRNEVGGANASIIMYTQNSHGTLSIPHFAAIVSHEIAHNLGLGDAYGDLPGVHGRPYTINNGYRLSGKNDEISFRFDETSMYTPSSGLMSGAGTASLNDFEMILLAFVENEQQLYVPGRGRPQSRAIKSKLTFFHVSDASRELEWWGDRSFIPVGTMPRFYRVSGVIWVYFVENGQITILAIYSPNGTSTEITIPSTIGGLPVVRINDYAFHGENLTSVTIPAGVRSIGIGAFQDCHELESITIPAGVTEIGISAFQDCHKLESITIPASVTSIGDWAFYNCAALKQIAVVEGNQHFSSVGGVLFNKSGTELIQYPIGNESTTYAIPSTVTAIKGGAFAYSANLERITIPASVTSIGDWGFAGAAKLKSIIFMGVTPPTFGVNAFWNTSKITIYVPFRPAAGTTTQRYEETLAREINAAPAEERFSFAEFFVGCECYRSIIECECDCPHCGRDMKTCRNSGVYRRYCVGDVKGNGKIEVHDAIAILRLVIDLPSEIVTCTCTVLCTNLMECPTGRCLDAWNAALIIGNNIAPSTTVAIQILRWLMELPSEFDRFNWERKSTS